MRKTETEKQRKKIDGELESLGVKLAQAQGKADSLIAAEKWAEASKAEKAVEDLNREIGYRQRRLEQLDGEEAKLEAEALQRKARALDQEQQRLEGVKLINEDAANAVYALYSSLCSRSQGVDAEGYGADFTADQEAGLKDLLDHVVKNTERVIEAPIDLKDSGSIESRMGQLRREKWNLANAGTVTK